MAAGTSRVAETRNKRSYGDGLLWTDAEGAAGMQVCIAQMPFPARKLTIVLPIRAGREKSEHAMKRKKRRLPPEMPRPRAGQVPERAGGTGERLSAPLVEGRQGLLGRRHAPQCAATVCCPLADSISKHL